LPNDAGIIFKVLGRETSQVKAKVREFWGVVRQEIIGASLPPPISGASGSTVRAG
jgi:urease accessory protein